MYCGTGRGVQGCRIIRAYLSSAWVCTLNRLRCEVLKRVTRSFKNRLCIVWMTVTSFPGWACSSLSHHQPGQKNYNCEACSSGRTIPKVSEWIAKPAS
ncbi:uncharacterized protein BCR38DRAFT_430228 [Pseudomassariella vexata]|uniref:Uncharacterized protein n=1 Tax=Pseudomassariella vexata TaxID=1141098 RepID=A0A1Y2E556_9PEZI|nr:uncharacterized protein BCR38DRAFT_430228 [Pseudomassariella vexata]ORY66426.1 hypothetical protein BCR38DRAFT_430228 [Pseudomassariella vexata]